MNRRNINMLVIIELMIAVILGQQLYAKSPDGNTPFEDLRQDKQFVELMSEEEKEENHIDLAKGLASSKVLVGDTFFIDISFINKCTTNVDVILNTAVVDLSSYSVIEVLSSDTLCTDIAPDSCVSNFFIPVFLPDTLERNQYLMGVYRFSKEANWNLLRSREYEDIIGMEGSLKEENADISYTVDGSFKNVSAEFPSVVDKGDTLLLKLKPLVGYGLPDTVKVYMSEKEILAEEFAYNVAEGLLSIPNITGNVWIEVSGRLKEIPYSILSNLSHVELSIMDKGFVGQSLTAVFKSDEGYRLPEAIEIKMSGKMIDPSLYMYDVASGNLKIDVVTGDLEVSVEGIKYFNVKTDLDNLSLEDFPPIVDEYSTLKGVFNVSEGFQLPNRIKISLGGKELSPFQYSYSPSTGVFEIGNITADVEIVAFGVGKIMTLNPEKVTSDSITLAWNLSFQLDQYELRIYEGGRDGDILAEKVLDAEAKAYSFGQLKPATDYFITVSAKRENREVVRMEVEARTKESSVSNETIKQGKDIFFVTGGQIYLQLAEISRVTVFNLSGVCVYSEPRVGQTVIPLAKGMYILVIGNQQFKIVI